jgi:hypothetical protein
MDFDLDAITELFDKYQVACDAEYAARKELLSAMESGIKDPHTFSELVSHFRQAHNKVIGISSQIQQYPFGV